MNDRDSPAGADDPRSDDVTADDGDAPRSPRDIILARRRVFIATAVATLALGCDRDDAEEETADDDGEEEGKKKPKTRREGLSPGACLNVSRPEPSSSASATPSSTASSSASPSSSSNFEIPPGACLKIKLPEPEPPKPRVCLRRATPPSDLED